MKESRRPLRSWVSRKLREAPEEWNIVWRKTVKKRMVAKLHAVVRENVIAAEEPKNQQHPV